MSEEVKNESVRRAKKSKIGGKRFVILALLVLGFGGAGYFYKQYSDLKSNPTEVLAQKNESDTKRIIGSIKEILFVPADAPEPTVARVDDPSVLQKANPDFYKDVEVNDYLVIYKNRAIVYREAINQIINVAPIVSADSLKDKKNPPAGSTAAPAN